MSGVDTIPTSRGRGHPQALLSAGRHRPAAGREPHLCPARLRQPSARRNRHQGQGRRLLPVAVKK
nr:MAG TPA: hypothetical protein [Caudoviricetes sp.]